jgi:hypothetical protein
MGGECEELAHSLQKYALMREEKNKCVKVEHSSPALWRSIKKGATQSYKEAST